MLSALIHLTDQEHITLLSNIREPPSSQRRPEAPSWSPSSEMAPGGKKLCFVFIFFFILAQFPSGKREWGRGERF